MIDVDIDVSDLQRGLDLTQGQVDELKQYTVEQLASEFAYMWGREAKSLLGSSRNEYINAIQVGKRGQFTSVVFLNPAAWLPNAIELGYSSFDMKEGFLNSPKVKIGKSGPYLTIPFRFATSGSIGESSVFSAVLPPDIERKAKKLPEGKQLGLSSIPNKHRIPKSAALRRKQDSISFKKLESSKQTSIYEGLQKQPSGGYINFRRVSLRSDADSFIHPGFEAREIALKALSNLDVEGVASDAVDQFLINAGI